MTCIVGIAEGGKVIIGGDSAGVGGYSLTVRSDEKVFKNGEFLFGFTTSFRMGQILRFAFSPPARVENIDDYKYLTTTFIDAVRAALKAGGFAMVENGGERGGTFLFGYRGGLYIVDSDYQVGASRDGFMACGCGDQIANGAMFATAGLIKDPQVRVKLALEAAERLSAGVRAPFSILEI